MLAVMLPEAELLPLLPADLSISLINGPSLCVVAGPVAAVAEFERMLNGKGVICRPVQNAHRVSLENARSDREAHSRRR